MLLTAYDMAIKYTSLSVDCICMLLLMSVNNFLVYFLQNMSDY